MTITQQKIDADRINAVRVGVEAFVKAAGCNDVVADAITNHVEALVKQAELDIYDNDEQFGETGARRSFGGAAKDMLRYGGAGTGIGLLASLKNMASGRGNSDKALEALLLTTAATGAGGALFGGLKHLVFGEG